MLQARMSQGDPRLYNPNRDVAHCFGQVMDELNERIQHEKWEALRKICRENGVGPRELAAAVAALDLFVAQAVELPKEKMGECLERAGFWKVPEAANIAVSALLGSIMIGMFFVGARMTTINGEGPCDDLQHLRQAGAECCREMAKPRWRRCLDRALGRFSRIWRAIKGG